MAKREILKYSLTDKAQADGDQIISVSDSYTYPSGKGRPPYEKIISDWQVHIVLSATPTNGTIDIGVKTPGASSFVNLSAPVNLTGDDLLVDFSAVCEEIRISPDSLDADKTYSVYIVGY